MGPIWWIAPLLFAIEVISHLFRPFTLGLRLMGNMTGDHTVLGAFLELVPIGVPVVFYCLGLFVCAVQALVFYAAIYGLCLYGSSRKSLI